MKSRDDIQRAHDTLVAQVTGEVPFLFDESARLPMRAALDVLCWVLGHDHNVSFAHVLENLDAGLRDLGYELKRADAPAAVTPSPESPPGTA